MPETFNITIAVTAAEVDALRLGKIFLRHYCGSAEVTDKIAALEKKLSMAVLNTVQDPHKQ